MVREAFKLRLTTLEVTGATARLTITLPEATPESLIRGHLEHFAVEFSTWTRHARAQGM